MKYTKGKKDKKKQKKKKKKQKGLKYKIYTILIKTKGDQQINLDYWQFWNRWRI